MSSCPRCGCEARVIEPDVSFDTLRYACGYAVAMRSDAIGGGILECGACRARSILARTWNAAKHYWPTAEVWSTAGVRVVVGCLLLASEPAMPEGLQSWWHLAGRVFVIMAAWCLLGHAERTFTTQVREVCVRGWKMVRGT